MSGTHGHTHGRKAERRQRHAIDQGLHGYSLARASGEAAAEMARQIDSGELGSHLDLRGGSTTEPYHRASWVHARAMGAREHARATGARVHLLI